MKEPAGVLRNVWELSLTSEERRDISVHFPLCSALCFLHAGDQTAENPVQWVCGWKVVLSGVAKYGGSCQEVGRNLGCTVTFPLLSLNLAWSVYDIWIIVFSLAKQLFCFQNIQSYRSGGPQSTMRTTCTRCSCLSPTNCWEALWHQKKSRRGGSSSYVDFKNSMHVVEKRSCNLTKRGWTGYYMYR